MSIEHLLLLSIMDTRATSPDASLQNYLQSLDPIKKTDKKEEKSYSDILQRVLGPKRENVFINKEGRRFIILSIYEGLEEDKTSQFIKKIRNKIKTAGFYSYAYSYWIENIEDGRLTLYYKNEKQDHSPRFDNINNVKIWLKEKKKPTA